MKRQLHPIIILILTCGGFLAQAKVDIATTVPIPMIKIDQNQKMSYREMSNYLPDGVQYEDDRDLAARKIADKGLQNWWRNSEIRHTPIVRTTERVEKRLQTQIVLKDDARVEHKVTMKLHAFQAMATLEYQGWTHAELRYDSREQQSGLEILEKIGRRQSMVLGHYSNNKESWGALGLRWGW